MSSSGKRKVIAFGSLDISEYIMEEPTSHDITVTLKPVKKTVLSGSLEFTLSSVILEDGIPRWVILICRHHQNYYVKYLENWCQLNCYGMEPPTCSTQIKLVQWKLVLLPFCRYQKVPIYPKRRDGFFPLYGLRCMCSPKGYDFSAILVITMVLILAVLVLNRMSFIILVLDLCLFLNKLCFHRYR